MNAVEILKKYWGYDSFRSLQEEIVTSVLSGHDTLGMLPTGGGKSITFQVPGIAIGGLTLVVTPLIALMKDQADHLIERGIKAAAIYTGMTREEVQATYDRVIAEHYNFLYVSPERLQTQMFINKLPYLDIRLLVVDEAHCISQWGYDFRPPYLRIADFRKALTVACPKNGEIPCIALTATATPDVVKDICQKLDFRPGYEVHQASFVRPNLTYTVIRTTDLFGDMVQLLEKFKPKEEDTLKTTSGAAIVYVRSRRKTQTFAESLELAGIPATFYHAGLTPEQKQQRQEAWMSGEIPVIVATNAFGMGIDKSNVRVVIHEAMPPSPEEYFQEAGRAGRDGKPATAYLFATSESMGDLINHINEAYPDRDYIRMVYERLAYFYQIAPGAAFNHFFDFDLYRFCGAYKLQMVPVISSLRILTMAGYIKYDEEPESHSRLMFTCSKEHLYHLENFDKECQIIISAILRQYTGVFADYKHIDEDHLSRYTKLDRETIYIKLQLLTRFHVLSYIPARKLPSIYYCRPRLDTDEVTIPHQVFEDRKRRDQDRAEAMIDYAFNNNECRLSKLLKYFGEKPGATCGKCDVCMNEHPQSTTEIKVQIKSMVLSYLQNNGDTSTFVLLSKVGHPEHTPNIIREMLQDEEITLNKGKLSVNKG